MKQKIGYLKENKTVSTYTLSENDYINLSDRGKVLLVDDDVTILKLLENALTELLDEKKNIAKGLYSGADDYLTKLFLWLSWKLVL